VPRPFTRGRTGLYVPSGGVWTPPHPTDLKLWLKLEGDLTDSSGNGKNFLDVSSSGFVQAPDGTKQVLELNGTSQYVYLPGASNTGILGGTSASYGLWFRARSFGSSDYGRFFSCDYSDSPPIDGFVNNGYGDHAASLRYYFNPSGDVSELPNGSIVLDNWHHIFTTVENNSQIIYLDGVSLVTASEPITSLRDSSVVIFLGNRDTYDRYFDGYFSGGMFYRNRALTPAEVVDIYTNTTP